jgi:hypothetical protein
VDRTASAARRHAELSAPDRRAIRLLRETPSAGGSAQPARSSTGQVESGCVSAGPFVERAQAEMAASQLQKLGFKSRLRASNDEIRVGKWVRVPNLATAEDATNALAALKAAGVADAEIVREDPSSNTVSLGVFGEPARAAGRRVGPQGRFLAVGERRTRTADVSGLT